MQRIDATSKILLATIALGLWVHIGVTLFSPAPSSAQSAGSAAEIGILTSVYQSIQSLDTDLKSGNQAIEKAIAAAAPPAPTPAPPAPGANGGPSPMQELSQIDTDVRAGTQATQSVDTDVKAGVQATQSGNQAAQSANQATLRALDGIGTAIRSANSRSTMAVPAGLPQSSCPSGTASNGNGGCIYTSGPNAGMPAH